MAQTPCIRVAEGFSLDRTFSADAKAGDVVLVGTKPLIVSHALKYTEQPVGAVDSRGLFDIPQTAAICTAGNAIYWNPTGTPKVGDPASGAASETVTAYPLGRAAPMQPNGLTATTADDKYVRVLVENYTVSMTAITGSVTVDDILGSDADLEIKGKAGAAGAGGAVSGVGGAGDGAGNAGGAWTITGGAGVAAAAGTGGAGGSVARTGGAGGGDTTGTGGAGGAAASAGGNGGNVSGAGTGGAGGAAGATGGAGGTAATTGTGGEGGAISSTAGAGGAAAGAGTGGVGGAATFTAGAGGATAAGTSGVGGAAGLISGAGGAGGIAGAGGAGGVVTITSGVGGLTTTGAGTTGAGGAINITSGAGGASGATGTCGVGGTISITAGAGGSAVGAGAAGNGGSIVLTPGAAGTHAGGTAGKTGLIRLVGMPTWNMAGPQVATNTATLNVAQLKGQFITATPTAAATYTLPTGADMTAAFANSDLDAFEFYISNVATDATYIITMAAGAQFTYVGSTKIPANEAATGGAWGTSTGRFLAKRTDAANWVCYRV